MKELIHQMFKENNQTEVVKLIKEFISMAYESKIKHLIRFAKSIMKFSEFIINHTFFNVTNGLIEGMNNKIKNIKRRAYGALKLDLLRKIVIMSFLDKEFA